MKKEFEYYTMSNRICNESGCSKKIKMNVITRTPDARKCYVHNRTAAGLDPRSRKNNKHNRSRRIDGKIYRER